MTAPTETSAAAAEGASRDPSPRAGVDRRRVRRGGAGARWSSGRSARTYRELASEARVASFLPILTEKVARDRLTGLVGRHVRAHAERLSA